MRSSDVLAVACRKDDQIDVRIEISFNRLDPPEGVAARVPRPGGGPLREAQGFVGWLGLFGLLQALTDDRLDEPPA